MIKIKIKLKSNNFDCIYSMKEVLERIAYAYPIRRTENIHIHMRFLPH